MSKYRLFLCNREPFAINSQCTIHNSQCTILSPKGVVAMMRQKCKLLFVTLVLFYRFGGDSRGRLGGVVLLYVGGGGGDGSPSLAGGETACG